jgi:6-phosphogluconolactonase (cycloisomerase 2 family)
MANTNAFTVQAYTINASTGALTSVGTTATGPFPYYVACDPTGKFVYVTNASAVDAGGNTVQTYTINQSTGALTSVGTVAAGVNPYGVACDPTGKFVYVTNYGSNTVQAYTINQVTGALTSVGTTATGTNPWSVACDPTGKFVYVTNFNSSTVQAYTINAITGALTSVGTTATGTYPIGVAVDPIGRFAFVPNYNSNTVQAYTITTGFVPRGTTTLPASMTRPYVTKSDNTGKFLYVGGSNNATAGILQAYSINQTTGVLTAVGSAISPASTEQCVDLVVDTYNRFLYACFIGSTLPSPIFAYSINQSTGALTLVGNYGSTGNVYYSAVDSNSEVFYYNVQNFVEAYAINQSTGALTYITTYSADNPLQLATIPNKNRYLATATLEYAGLALTQFDYQVSQPSINPATNIDTSRITPYQVNKKITTMLPRNVTYWGT